MASMEKHLFNLKFASKELERSSKKADKVNYREATLQVTYPIRTLYSHITPNALILYHAFFQVMLG